MFDTSKGYTHGVPNYSEEDDAAEEPPERITHQFKIRRESTYCLKVANTVLIGAILFLLLPWHWKSRFNYMLVNFVYPSASPAIFFISYQEYIPIWLYLNQLPYFWRPKI